jgi:hypothetical protein
LYSGVPAFGKLRFCCCALAFACAISASNCSFEISWSPTSATASSGTSSDDLSSLPPHPTRASVRALRTAASAMNVSLCFFIERAPFAAFLPTLPGASPV